MFINRFSAFDNRAKKTQVSEKIHIKSFVDHAFDTAGWYALGHHDPQKFFGVVIERSSDYSRFSPASVRQAWAKIKGDDIKIARHPVQGAVPITLIEDLMYLSGLF
jgi:hypothetical protein